MSPVIAFVASLNCLQNSAILMPCGPSAVPTGGAGLAAPAGSCNLIVVFIFLAIASINHSNPATWERGRGNGSFPVAEALKPLGFKEERSDDGAGLAAPAGSCNLMTVFIFLAMGVVTGY